MGIRKIVVELAGRRTFRMKMTSSQQSGIQTREQQWQPTKKKKYMYIYIYIYKRNALQGFNLFFWMSSGLIYSDVFLYLTYEFHVSYKQNSFSHLSENTEHCPRQRPTGKTAYVNIHCLLWMSNHINTAPEHNTNFLHVTADVTGRSVRGSNSSGGEIFRTFANRP